MESQEILGDVIIEGSAGISKEEPNEKVAITNNQFEY